MMDNGANTPRIDARPCAECGEDMLVRSEEDQTVYYGSGDDRVELRVRVPVWSCKACGDAFTDWEAEEIRHAAVCHHIKRLTPAEVRAIRTAEGQSQEAFAELTGIGLASIKRWESGNQIQSESFDRYLRLLGQEGNRKRLRTIVYGLANSAIKAAEEARGKKVFRTAIPASARARAQSFELCPSRQPAET